MIEQAYATAQPQSPEHHSILDEFHNATEVLDHEVALLSARLARVSAADAPHSVPEFDKQGAGVTEIRIVLDRVLASTQRLREIRERLEV